MILHIIAIGIGISVAWVMVSRRLDKCETCVHSDGKLFPEYDNPSEWCRLCNDFCMSARHKEGDCGPESAYYQRRIV